MLTLRNLVSESDFARIAPLVTAAGRAPVTAADLRDQLQKAPPGSVIRWMLAEDGEGEPVGVSKVTRFPWWSSGRYDLWLGVAPDQRRQGIGSALFDEALAFLAAQGATRLEAEVADDDEPSLAFAAHRGYGVNRHLLLSTLAVAAFDPAPLAHVLPYVEAAGIRFFTMADVGNTPEAQERLWALNRSVTLEIPGREPTFSSLAEYRQRVCGAAWYRPEAQLLAADGDRWVGLASLEPLPGGLLQNRMTGVVREYRGRQIALALKLLAIEYARAHGFAELSTANDAENGPMLAVNRKLGYRPAPGVYLLARTV